MKNRVVALNVGHSPKDSGAVNSKTKETEFHFNGQVALQVQDFLRDTIPVEVVWQDAYSTLPKKINALNPLFIVSLHCNAYNGEASGSEVLYWHTSKKGEDIAEVFLKHILYCLNLPNRGIKSKKEYDRGASLLKNTKAPCIICEPFFIDNDNDLQCAIKNFNNLIDAYVEAIREVYEKRV